MVYREQLGLPKLYDYEPREPQCHCCLEDFLMLLVLWPTCKCIKLLKDTLGCELFFITEISIPLLTPECDGSVYGIELGGLDRAMTAGTYWKY